MSGLVLAGTEEENNHDLGPYGIWDPMGFGTLWDLGPYGGDLGPFGGDLGLEVGCYIGSQITMV